MEVERPVSMMPGLADGFFTEADLAAADQLVQLSVSGGAEATSPTSSSLSVQSVNNTEAAPRKGSCDDTAPWMDRRARKRYRRVAELYRATRPLKRTDAGGKRRREEIAGNR